VNTEYYLLNELFAKLKTIQVQKNMFLHYYFAQKGQVSSKLCNVILITATCLILKNQIEVLKELNH